MATNIVSWGFSIIFGIIGLLNVALVHPVPGIFYILLSFVYSPWASNFFREKWGLSAPFIAKVILAFVILWGTLAVGDLAEVLGL